MSRARRAAAAAAMRGAGHPSMTSDAGGTERRLTVVVFWRGDHGFIEVPKRSSWYFTHVSHLVDAEQLAPGQRVRFTPTPTARGPRALGVELLAPAPPAAERPEK